MTPMTEERAIKPRQESTTAYIGLGANLGEREATLKRALDAIDALPSTRVWMISRFHETKPVGVEDQPDFVNAVARIETSLEPRALLDSLLEIERRLGRDRSREQRWGPRTIDLDLLVYGDVEIGEPGLVVPHPRVLERPFVTEPLREVMPGPWLRIPGQGLLLRGG
jgi:2-amino-4-hydroxy-6-hydroxymethyldihydropteridine diphosphokinase